MGQKGPECRRRAFAGPESGRADVTKRSCRRGPAARAGTPRNPAGVGVIRRGRLEQAAAPSALYADPATAFVAEFAGTMNRIPGELDGEQVRVLGAVEAPVLVTARR
jgi:hypothetical protein